MPNIKMEKIVLKIIDHKIYTIKNVFSFIPPKDLNDGDRVVYLASRGSSSYSTYGKHTGVDHGWVKIEGIVEVQYSGERYIRLDKNQENFWKQPRGREQTEQLISIANGGIIQVIKE